LPPRSGRSLRIRRIQTSLTAQIAIGYEDDDRSTSCSAAWRPIGDRQRGLIPDGDVVTLT